MSSSGPHDSWCHCWHTVHFIHSSNGGWLYFLWQMQHGVSSDSCSTTTFFACFALGLLRGFSVEALGNLHFYPRDAMLARVIAIATCPSVCLSVTRRYCAKTKKVSGMFSSPSGSPKTLVSDAKFHHQILRGSPERRPQTRVGRKNSAIF